MESNTRLNEALEEFQEVCRARRNAYSELLPYAKDKFCKRLITNNIIQSNEFLEELTHTHLETDYILERESFVTLVYRSLLAFRPLHEYEAKREMYVIVEEMERVTIDFYSNILTDHVPAPLDMVIAQQLEDIKNDYEKILFLKRALSEV